MSLVAYGSESSDAESEIDHETDGGADVTTAFKAKAAAIRLQAAPDVSNPANEDEDFEENVDDDADNDVEDVRTPESSGNESDQNDWPFKIQPRQAARLMPSPPRGKCSNSLQRKIEQLLDKKHRNGLDLNHSVQSRKDFRNPSIYDKLVSYLDLDELGSNFTSFNPAGWGPESYYEKLATLQKEHYEKKQKESANRTQVEFVKGTKRPPTSSSASSADEPRKKRSKWDTGPAL